MARAPGPQRSNVAHDDVQAANLSKRKVRHRGHHSTRQREVCPGHPVRIPASHHLVACGGAQSAGPCADPVAVVLHLPSASDVPTGHQHDEDGNDEGPHGCCAVIRAVGNQSKHVQADTPGVCLQPTRVAALCRMRAEGAARIRPSSEGHEVRGRALVISPGLNARSGGGTSR